MNDSTITLRGYVGADPVVRSVGDSSVANFRMACTPRKFNRATGEWSDGVTQWFTVSAWRQLGENVGRSLRKGDPVVVHGRLTARSYVNKDGLEVNTFEVEANVVGHDLNRGMSSLSRNPRSLAAVAVPPPEHGDEEPQHDPISDWRAPGADPWEQKQTSAEETAPAEETEASAAA
ncbi:single-strand DNA-binding protein [Nocardioides luteus]|uniref:Single-stranded DNA-binding protein n=1 Tax=Nocardioides luteus TaxID=1844 RepID=A0ABQ5SU61_9ACTN|nr:single-stranded DNA-binding protein [Nocardioides luteus]MDR7309159.1 single-strand DNA-binding protein [Nocardioides luteus]GGR49409.1 single-stranded DNA-binding protein 1 [Nocardioides luteus]GLJ67565.1 single-stranded DNA-binding protein 1 [Nocardioides luteus]